jgi:hypothetical protein
MSCSSSFLCSAAMSSGTSVVATRVFSSVVAGSCGRANAVKSGERGDVSVSAFGGAEGHAEGGGLEMAVLGVLGGGGEHGGGDGDWELELEGKSV